MGTRGVWVTRGFEAFRAGSFGNAGENLYVSAAGILQRIHHFDVNADGRLDLVFCNSQEHWERPPALVYHDPLGVARRSELPADGAWSAAVADLDGDGRADLVLGMWENGIRADLNAFVYYGAPGGWSERYRQLLPAPSCTSVAVGDFDGDGRPDLAFATGGRIRVFRQTGLGFEPKRFRDLDVAADQLDAADLDGDGCADLVVRTREGGVSVLWGSPDGIDAGRASVVHDPPAAPVADDPARPKTFADCVPDARPLVRVLRIAGALHLFVAAADAAVLVPVGHGRRFGDPHRLACGCPMAAAVGDVDGDGQDDLVVACREPRGEGERSWVFWGGDGGFSDTRRTALPTQRACDVAVADLDGDGAAEVVICQSHTARSYDTDSPVYRIRTGRSPVVAARLATHDGRRAFAARVADGEGLSVVIVNARARGMLGEVDASIFLGGPDGFAPQRRIDLPARDAVESLCVDVNDDGRPDVILANCSENSVWDDPGSFVYLNGPSGFARQPEIVLPTTRAHGICCADIDRDGRLELVVAGFDNPELLVFHGTGDGFDLAHPDRIRMEIDGVTYREPRWIALADLDGDGWLDLVVPQIAADRSFILWGGPGGFSMSRCRLLSVWHAACARVADLDGDGRLELILGGHAPSREGPHDSFIHIYWNGPDGLSEERRTMLPANAVNALAVADFDNDGTLDVFACSYHDGRERDIDSFIYWNRKGRGFTADDRTTLRTHSASACLAADFDGDGWIDLAVANHKVDGDHRGWSAVWWNGPGGFRDDRVTRLPTNGPHGMTCAPVGNLLDRGPEEYYTSAPYRLPGLARVTGIRWDAVVAPTTWVKARLRCASSAEALERSPWAGPEDAPEGTWVQYRLALGAANGCGTPRVSAVSVEYELA